MGLFDRLKKGLAKTSNNLSQGLTKIFSKGKLNPETLEELEEILLQADVGMQSTTYIIEQIKKKPDLNQLSISEIQEILANSIYDIVSPYANSKSLLQNTVPTVIMICGVNGNGKTTTTGKLAAQYQSMGHKIMLVACDTFRAAAVDQLKIWAERSDSTFFSGEEGSDPASVAYKAYQQAVEDKIDIMFIDTAGRLHTNNNLMSELVKIKRVLQKINPDIPSKILMILDATTGQNALQQMEIFNHAVGIDGIIITKLDGTAKAGIVIALCKKFAKPIYAIGVGEKKEDLQNFNALEYAKALVGI